MTPDVRASYVTPEGTAYVQIVVIEGVFLFWGIADTEIQATGMFTKEQAEDEGRVIYWRTLFGNLTQEHSALLPAAYRAFVEQYPQYEALLRSDA